MYDATIARWLVPDPMRQYFSPYLAMGNNPIRRVDPDGGDDRTDDPATLAFSEQYAITAKQTFADKLWNALWDFTQRFNEIHGYQYMSESGSGLGWNEFSRPGVADNIIMDPTTGLVVFKGVNGKVFKWDGRTPIPKSGWEPIKEAISYMGGTWPSLSNAKQGVELLVDRFSIKYHKIWPDDSLKPRYMKGSNGIILFDSIPSSSNGPDTLDRDVIEKRNGWGTATDYYDLITS
jgi:hypothetical protein